MRKTKPTQSCGVTFRQEHVWIDDDGNRRSLNVDITDKVIRGIVERERQKAVRLAKGWKWKANPL